MGKYTVRTAQTRKFDKETGEIFEQTSSMSVVKNQFEPFFLTYSKEIMALYSKAVFNATTKVLWKLMEFAEWDTGKVYMTAERIKDIMKVCGISKASYYRAVTELKDVGIVSGKGNTLTIAENMFWKGYEKTRNELKKAKLMVSFSPVYDEDDKTITLLDVKD